MIFFSIPIIVYLSISIKNKLEAREGNFSFVASITKNFIRNKKVYWFSILLLILYILKIQESIFLIILILDILKKNKWTQEFYFINIVLFIILNFYLDIPYKEYIIAFNILIATNSIEDRSLKTILRIYLLNFYIFPLINILSTFTVNVFEEISIQFMRTLKQKRTNVRYPKLSTFPTIAKNNKGILALDITKCNACGECENICPNNSIIVQQNNLIIDYSKCLWCNFCVNICKPKALNFIKTHKGTIRRKEDAQHIFKLLTK